MNGFIDVEVHAHEAHFEARCSCGWCGGESASVDWSELALLGHFDSAHKEAIA